MSEGRGIFGLVFGLGWKLFLVYAAVFAFVFLTQRDLMYHPDPTPFDPEAVGNGAFQKVDLVNDAGEPIRHWYAKPNDFNKPAIVYFQGNAGTLASRSHKYLPWIEDNFGVFLIGYRGYGNAGKPTEDNLYADARQAIFHLLDRVDRPPSIVFYGESLGTGIATQMALEYQIGALILEAPFTSYPDVGVVHYPWLPVRWLALDRYETLSKIGRVKAPLMVIHGTTDKTVPFDQGKKVFEAANEPKTSFFVEGAGHGNLYDFGTGEAVDNFLEGLGWK